MAFPPTVDDLCGSAQQLARSSLQAHVSSKHHLVALYGGTSLEHLAKACLTRRSPALIGELRSEDSFRSLLLLLGIASRGATPPLRTVGLRDALRRARILVTSSASWEHLMALADMRDGTVHIAANDEVEEQLVVAFVQHTDALLDDLDRDRGEFWGPQLEVANALLGQASNKVAHRVQVKLAAARVNFAAYDANLLQAIRQWTDAQVLNGEQAHAECPACSSQGVAAGFRYVAVSDSEREPGGKIVRPILGVWFHMDSFACRICGLRLDSSAEITAAGMDETWDEGPEQVDYYSPPHDEDQDYERWREEHHGDIDT